MPETGSLARKESNSTRKPGRQPEPDQFLLRNRVAGLSSTNFCPETRFPARKVVGSARKLSFQAEKYRVLPGDSVSSAKKVRVRNSVSSTKKRCAGNSVSRDQFIIGVDLKWRLIRNRKKQADFPNDIMRWLISRIFQDVLAHLLLKLGYAESGKRYF